MSNQYNPYVPLTIVKATDNSKSDEIEESFRKNWKPTVNVVDGSLIEVKKYIMDKIVHEFVKERLGSEPMTSTLKSLDNFKVVCDDSDLIYRVGRIEFCVGKSDSPSFRIIDGPEDKQTNFDWEMFLALKMAVGYKDYIDEVIAISNAELITKGLNQLSNVEKNSIHRMLREWEIYNHIKHFFDKSDYIEDIVDLVTADLKAKNYIVPLTMNEIVNMRSTLREGGKKSRPEGLKSMEYDDLNYYSAPKRSLSISDEGIFSFIFPATNEQPERSMVFRPRNGMAVEDLIKYLDKELPYTYNESSLSEQEKETIRGKCGNSR